MAERVRDINPACRVRALRMFYLPENAGEVDLSRYDYVVDAVDTVSAKLGWPSAARPWGVPLISAMGSGNKLDPSAFSVSDLSKTEGCPLARVMRKELRKRGIHHLKVVWSREEPPRPLAPGGGAPPAGTPAPPPPPPGRPGLGLLCPRRRRAGAGRGGHPGSGRSLTASKSCPCIGTDLYRGLFFTLFQSAGLSPGSGGR